MIVLLAAILMSLMAFSPGRGQMPASAYVAIVKHELKKAPPGTAVLVNTHLGYGRRDCAMPSSPEELLPPDAVPLLVDSGAIVVDSCDAASDTPREEGDIHIRFRPSRFREPNSYEVEGTIGNVRSIRRFSYDVRYTVECTDRHCRLSSAELLSVGHYFTPEELAEIERVRARLRSDSLPN